MMDESRLPSSAALAFLGDAVYSLYVRERLVALGISHSKELNEHSRRYVTAAAQEQFFDEIKGELSEIELSVARRAANSGHLNVPKHTKHSTYRAATGLEALLGAIHFSGDLQRLSCLLSKLKIEVTI